MAQALGLPTGVAAVTGGAVGDAAERVTKQIMANPTAAAAITKFLEGGGKLTRAILERFGQLARTSATRAGAEPSE